MPDSIDIPLVFTNLATTLKHLLGAAEVNKAQEAEIQTTIKQLNDFEGSINDLIDARIAAKLGDRGADVGLEGRVTALEEGLANLGHVFTDTSGADTGSDTSSDTVAGSAGDDTVAGGTGDDTQTTGQAADSLPAETPQTDIVSCSQADSAVSTGADTTTAQA